MASRIGTLDTFASEFANKNKDVLPWEVGTRNDINSNLYKGISPTTIAGNFGTAFNQSTQLQLPNYNSMSNTLQVPQVVTPNNTQLARLGFEDTQDMVTSATPGSFAGAEGIVNPQSSPLDEFSMENIGTGLSAVSGLWNAYNASEANKMNKKSINAQIDNMKQNRADRNEFKAGVTSAFA